MERKALNLTVIDLARIAERHRIEIYRASQPARPSHSALDHRVQPVNLPPHPHKHLPSPHTTLDLDPSSLALGNSHHLALAVLVRRVSTDEHSLAGKLGRNPDECEPGLELGELEVADEERRREGGQGDG